MTDNNHPITPPQELVQLWLENYFGCWDDVNVTVADASSYIATQASQWGYEQRGAVNESELQKARDEELEACCEVLARELICDGKHVATDLRAVRRPKPPSLKEQAYNALDTYIYGEPDPNDKERTYNIIRRALKSLSD